jgi:hypothetical protein
VIQREVPSGAAVLEVGREVGGRLLGEQADLDVDAGGPQRGEAPAGDPRVGVLEGDDHAADAGGDDGIGAGGDEALAAAGGVGAGLEGGVERGAPSRLAGAGQRVELGVGTGDRLGGALEGAAVGGDQHGAHPGPRRHSGPDLLGQGHRPGHRLPVVHASASSPRSGQCTARTGRDTTPSFRSRPVCGISAA